MSKTREPYCAIFRMDEFGHPRFAHEGFFLRSEAEAFRDESFPGCVVLTYGEYKARQDPDTMSEAEVRRRFGRKDAPAGRPRSVVITGEIPRMTREQARAAAERLGFRVTSKLSPKTGYLWAGERPGRVKLAEAGRLGVPVVETLPEKESRNA